MRDPMLAKGTTLVLLVLALGWIWFLATDHLQARGTLTEPLENRLLDARFKLLGPQPAAPGIVIVAIDDATLDAGHAGPVGRPRLARLIRHIADSGAKAVALDVLLADAGQTSERAELAAALSRVPSVIAAAARFSDSGPASVIWPHPAFRAQAAVGLVNLTTDANGTPRYLPLFIDAEGAPQPSLALLAAVALSGDQARIDDEGLMLGDRRIPLDGGSFMPLRLLGPAGTVPTLSATRLMEEGTQEDLSDKLVVLGYSAAAMGDRFVTPFDDNMPGMEIIATAISQIVGAEPFRLDHQTRRWDVAHAAVLALGCLFLVFLAPLARAIVFSSALLLLSLGATLAFFAQGVVLNAALPLVASLPPALAVGILRTRLAREAARRSEQSLVSLRRFQSPALARRIESDPDYLKTPLEQALVIFFVDLTGFTALSQRLGAEGTQVLLQRFHGLIAETLEPRGGTIINYMGDGALAVFGLNGPSDGVAPADSALAAAQALEPALARLDTPGQAEVLTCRIGLHFGPVILSRLGADTHQQVSVSGDTVNIASRLMEVAKSEKGMIVASRDFAERVSDEAALANTLQTPVTIRGRSGSVEVVIWPRRADRA